MTKEDLELAGQQPALKAAADRFAEQRAQKSPFFAEINRLFPGAQGQVPITAGTAGQQAALIEKDIAALEFLGREAQRAVTARVEQDIKITVTQDVESLAGQIAKQLVPQLLELNAKTVIALEKQLKDALSNLRAGSRASFGIVKPP